MADEHIDVIADFVYDSENDGYNRENRLWRQKTEAPFIYRVAANRQERSYVAGSAQARGNVPVAERSALMSSYDFIGIVLMFYLACELLFSALLAWGFHIFSFDVELDFLSFTLSGDFWLVCGIRTFVNLLKYGLPLLLAVRFFKLPEGLRMPLSVGSVPEFFGSVGFGMLIGLISGLTDGEPSALGAAGVFTYTDTSAILTCAVVDVTFGTLLAEMLLRGALMPVLRQFGDVFAVLTMALCGFLLPNDLSGRLKEMLLGLTCGYLLLKSGSLLHCMIVRAVCATVNYARVILVYANDSVSLRTFTSNIFLFGALFSLIYLLLRVSGLGLSNRRSWLKLREKWSIAMQSPSMLVWLCCCVLSLLLRALY